MSVRAAVRRHRWVVAAIFVASWGWALAWPQGRHSGPRDVFFTDDGHKATVDYATRGWGLHGVVLVGTYTWRLEWEGFEDLGPLPPAEARAIIERSQPNAFGREGWFIDLDALGMACWAATLISVFSSTWWIALRRPLPPGMTRTTTAARLVKLAIWPTVLGTTIGLWLWNQLGRVAPPAVALLRPEWMLLGTLFVVSMGAVWLATPRRTGP